MCPSRTTTRPFTMVCRAPVGPQRNHASTGSAMAPANDGPVSDHTAMSATAPTLSSPISPSRPRHPAPPMVATSNAMRAVPACAPLRNLANNIACRASNHIDAESADDEPSTPRPTLAPAARRSTTGEMPDANIRFELGQCATPMPAAPRRCTSSWLGITQCATHVRLLHQPVRSRYSMGRHPKVAMEKSSSSAFSAKCVCRRTSNLSASSADRTISCSVTLNGEHGARATRVMAPNARSWCRFTASSLAARISSSSATTSSGGRPPSFSLNDIEPRVG